MLYYPQTIQRTKFIFLNCLNYLNSLTHMRISLLYCLSGILILFCNTAKAQYFQYEEGIKLSALEQKLDLLIYQTNNYIVQNSQCLSKIYSDLNKGRKIYSYGNDYCGSRSPLSIISKRDSEFFEKINEQYPELYSSLNKLIDFNTKVSAELMKGEFDWKMINVFMTDHEILCSEFNQESQKIRKKLREDGMQHLPLVLKEYLDFEYVYADKLKYFLRSTKAGNFPEKELAENLRISDSLSLAITEASKKDRRLKKVMQSLYSHQYNKANYLHNLEYDKLFESKYRNEYYFQLHNYYNNGIIYNLKTTFNTPYSLFVPFKPYNNLTSQEVGPAILHFTYVSNYLYTDSINNSQLTDFAECEKLTILLNKVIIANISNTKSLFNLRKQVHRNYVTSTKFIRLQSKKELYLNELKAAVINLNSRKNEAFATVSKQVSIFTDILKDCNTIYILLNLKLKNESLFPDDLNYIKTKIEDYSCLLHQLDRQIIILNKNINIALSPQVSYTDSWSKSSEELMGYCSELREEMLAIELKTIKTTKPSEAYDFSRPLTLHNQLIKEEDILLAGLEKLGELSIFCPYGIFEKLLSQGQLQHKKASVFADSETVPFKKGCCEGYLSVINYYNNSIKVFNEFSRLGAEKDTDYALLYHQQPVYNNLLLFKPALLPEIESPQTVTK
jgi:hypothetical protein